MNKDNPLEADMVFLANIRKWQALETKAIANTRNLMSKTGNPLIRMIMSVLEQDSKMHMIVQQMIIDYMTKESVYIVPEDLDNIADMLNAHMEAEKEALRFAEEAIEKTDLYVTRVLLSYLVADEKKHHELMEQLLHYNRVPETSSPHVCS